MNLPYKNIFVVVILLLSGCIGFFVSLKNTQTEKPFAPPPGVVTIETFHYPALFAAELRHDKAAGEKIFNQFCTSCHGKEPIIDVKAPHIGDKKAWAARRKMGMKTLLTITTTGVGAMPARGGCFECSDDELRQTIRYMLSQ